MFIEIETKKTANISCNIYMACQKLISTSENKVTRDRHGETRKKKRGGMRIQFQRQTVLHMYRLKCVDNQLNLVTQCCPSKYSRNSLSNSPEMNAEDIDTWSDVQWHSMYLNILNKPSTSNLSVLYDLTNWSCLSLCQPRVILHHASLQRSRKCAQ